MLQAVGRTPNGKKIAADKAGVAVTDRGFINVDIQMPVSYPPLKLPTNSEGSDPAGAVTSKTTINIYSG